MASGATAFKIDVDASRVDRLFFAVSHAVSPYSLYRFLETDAHEYFREQIELRFAYEGDKKSGAWEELSEATRKIRESQGYPGSSPINMRTGNLEDLLTTQLDVRIFGQGAMLSIPGDPPSGELEEKLRHAQQGVAAGDNPLFPNSSTPARPVLAADEADLAAMVAMLETHIMREMSTVL